MSEAKQIDSLVGLFVTDQEMYTTYRQRMTPILESMGGFFRYDFAVERTLKTDTDHPINRLFVISFPSLAVRDRFFADPRYLEIRQECFDSAVRKYTTLGQLVPPPSS